MKEVRETLTDSVVYEVLPDLSLKVLGQREGAHDPAVPVDDGARHAHALVHHALDRRPRGVDVAVRRDQDGPNEQDRDGELELVTWLGLFWERNAQEKPFS